MEAMCDIHVHSTMTRPSHSHCLRSVVNKPTTDELWISPVYRRLAVAKFSKSRVWSKIPEGSFSRTPTCDGHGRTQAYG